MTLINKPFVPQKLEEERDKDYLIFTTRLNKEEALILEEAKRLLHQPKDSTCFKQMAYIGFKTITSQESKQIIQTIFNNKRKNERIGLDEF